MTLTLLQIILYIPTLLGDELKEGILIEGKGSVHLTSSLG
jgi:hypothetical protein